MNLNYVGSLAEKKMHFKSFLAGEESLEENIFNSISIYVPKSLATANLSEEYGSEISGVTAEKYLVVEPVKADNYRDVLRGALLTQWLPVFNNGANIDVTLYVIVFDDTGFDLVTENEPTWAPLTTAFNDLYFVSVMKTMFSEHYDGSKLAEQESGNYDDTKYFDMLLALSNLCEVESNLSVCMAEVHVKIPEGSAEDANACKILSQTKADEIAHATKFSSTTLQERAQYLWGYLNLMGAAHTMLYIHNGHYMLPIILGKWFEKKNDSGEYVGNKLAKIRLTGNLVKPTGNPSQINGAVNLNLPKKFYKNIDEKNVGYFMSIADDSLNNAMLDKDRSVSNFPITAYLISKWIDYNTSQDMAKYVSAQQTLTLPVLTNEAAYRDLQTFLLSNIQKFSGTGRISKVELDFPQFSEVKKGNTIKGSGVWKAYYVDDIDGVEISGSIQF